MLIFEIFLLSFLLLCIAALVWALRKNQSLQLKNVRLETSLKEQEKQKNFGNLMETKFENLAQKIFDEKDEKLVRHNKQQLGGLLAPLNEKIQNFQNTFTTGSAAFKKEIELLRNAHLEINQETKNLTKALKGDSKTQGDWGEVILEKKLELSGLVKGEEYTIQKQFQDEEGRNVKPDVVLHLPQNRKIIIDSKVSLTAYETFINSTDEQQKEQYFKAHLSSIKRHIHNLKDKHYASIPKLRTPEFILMFIPIDPALYLALQNDDTLQQEALRSKIMLISPTTLMLALKTVYNIWKLEKQSKSAGDIILVASRMYDKFVDFHDDFLKIGKKLGESKKSYDTAYTKLSEGKGNIIQKMKSIEKLGIQNKKQLPNKSIASDPEKKIEELENP